MKILFVTPSLSMIERYGALSGAGSSMPNLGLMQLAAVTQQQGYPTFLIDAAAQGLSQQETLKHLEKIAPDILAISITTMSIMPAALLAEAAKTVLPFLRVVIGGPHPSAVPVDTIERFSSFDYAVIGEGEVTLLELLGALEGRRPLNQIDGIVFRQGEKVIANPRRAFLRDLDTLPRPAWQLLEGFPHRYSPPAFKVRKQPTASIVTSRGCPNQCIFCDRSVFGSSCNAFSAEYVVSMIVELNQKYGVREFCFEDDTFITFKPRLVEICLQLIERKLDISWSCLGRANHVTTENLKLMMRAGCWQISYGIESGSQQILKNIRKQVTLEQIRRALKMSNDAGLLNKGFLIVGHPGETLETLEMTYDFVMNNPLDDISVTMLTPFPGTELYTRATEFGTFDPDWKKMNLMNPVFIPYGLTEEDLKAAQKRMMRDFYLRPRVINNYCRRCLANPAMIFSVWAGFRSLLKSSVN